MFSNMYVAMGERQSDKCGYTGVVATDLHTGDSGYIVAPY